MIAALQFAAVGLSIAGVVSAGFKSNSLSAFTDLGIPVQSLTLAMDQAVVHDGKKEKIYTLSYDPYGPAFVIEADPDTGQIKTYPSPFEDAHDVYGFTPGKDTKVYFCTQRGAHFASFDTRTKEFNEIPNPAKPGYFYRMTTGPDGKIYGGVYGNMTLVVYDPKTKKGRAVCRLDENNRYPHSMVFGKDGLLYVGCGAEKSNVIVFDPKTEKVRDVLPEDKRGPGTCDVAVLPDGRVQFRLQRGGGQSAPEYFVAENGQCQPAEYVRAEELKLKDGRRVRIDGPAMALWVQDEGRRPRKIPLQVDRGGAAVFCLANGPDGNIYGGTYPLNLFRLNPKTDRMENLGNASGTTGEIYSMTCFKGKLYLASYPGGNLSVYDPKRPCMLGPDDRASKDKNANPRDLGSIQNFQHRPGSIIVGPDEKIYIGVIADYGSRTGSLTRFDPDTEQFKINLPFPDESVTGLAVTPGGELWCVSNNHLFLWDCEKEKVAFELAMAQAGNSRLRLCKNGLLYGVCTNGSALYAFDPKRRKIVSKVQLPWGQVPGSSWNALDTGPDGLVYGLVSATETKGILYVVDPGTNKPKKLGEHFAIHAGWAFTQQNIYLCAGSHVVKFSAAH